MFRDTRRQKLRNRVIFTALGVMVMTFGIWLNFHDQKQPTEEAAKEVAVEETEEKTQEAAGTHDADAEPDAAGEEKTSPGDEDEDEWTGTDVGGETYLIKEIDGIVKVFLCSDDGSRELYMTTSIPFELLSESDQQLFTDGVELGTEEELGRFLENFDS